MSGSAFADVNARGVATVASAFGLTVPDNCTQGGIGPCPACGAPTRHTQTKDKRGALGVRRDGLGWRCFQCDAHGDAVALAAYKVLGRVPERGSGEWPQVLAACAALGLCEATPTGTVTPRRATVSPPPRPAPPPPKRPPADEVADLWRRCVPVTDDAEVRRYLEGRRYSALQIEAIAALDLARALPPDGPLPAWCRFTGQTWRERGYRLVFPLVGAQGTMESLQARHLGDAKPKYLSPSGYEVRELVAANHDGRRMLAGQRRPERVVVTEGMTDYLTAATQEARRRPDWVPLYAAIELLRHHRATDHEPGYPPGYCFLCGLATRPEATSCDGCRTAVRLWTEADQPYDDAVVSVLAGSWCDTIAARVPDGLETIVATDADDAGKAYFEKVRPTLQARCTVSRWTP